MSRSSFRASRGLSGILITVVKDEVRWSVAPPEGPQAPSVAVQRLVLASFTQVFRPLASSPRAGSSNATGARVRSIAPGALILPPGKWLVVYVVKMSTLTKLSTTFTVEAGDIQQASSTSSGAWRRPEVSWNPSSGSTR